MYMPLLFDKEGNIIEEETQKTDNEKQNPFILSELLEKHIFEILKNKKSLRNLELEDSLIHEIITD